MRLRIVERMIIGRTGSKDIPLQSPGAIRDREDLIVTGLYLISIRGISAYIMANIYTSSNDVLQKGVWESMFCICKRGKP